MNAIIDWFKAIWEHWDRFWFHPSDAATLAVIRIFTGGMLLYTHFVWTLDLEGFFGRTAWLSTEFVRAFHDSPFAWSHLYGIESPATLWMLHILALVVFACLMVGFQSRLSSVLAFLLTVSYAHRASGALYGLDQVNGFLSLYLILGRCGDAYSVDQWLRIRAGARAAPSPAITTNIAVRLMQLHLCVVYLFAGCGKLLGESWWQGTALWGAFANYEYQTLDMTWTAHSMLLINVLTLATLYWEISYAALVWPRLTRPVVLLLAIPLHLGIAFCMGMITFGVIMLVANFSFVPPSWVRLAESKLLARHRPAATSAPMLKPHGRRARRRSSRPVG